MEFLRFIFSSFWIWAGFIIMICAVTGLAYEFIKQTRMRRNIRIYKCDNNCWNIEITNAKNKDISAAIEKCKELK